MGQKVHPIGMRVGIIRDWDAKWYAEKEYADYLHEDLAIRKFINKELAEASVSTIEIERAVNKVIVSLHTAKIQVWLSVKVAQTLTHFALNLTN